MTLAEEKMSGRIREVIDCSKFRSLEYLLLVNNFVRRFVLKLKAKELGGAGITKKFGSGEDGKKGEVLWLKYVQCIMVQ